MQKFPSVLHSKPKWTSASLLAKMPKVDDAAEPSKRKRRTETKADYGSELLPDMRGWPAYILGKMRRRNKQCVVRIAWFLAEKHFLSPGPPMIGASVIVAQDRWHH